LSEEKSAIKDLIEFTVYTSDDQIDYHGEKIISVNEGTYIRFISYYNDCDAAFGLYTKEVEKFDIVNEFITMLDYFESEKTNFEDQTIYDVYNYFNIHEKHTEKTFILKTSITYEYHGAIEVYLQINMTHPAVCKNEKFMKLLNDISKSEKTGIVICLDNRVIELGGEYTYVISDP